MTVSPVRSVGARWGRLLVAAGLLASAGQARGEPAPPERVAVMAQGALGEVVADGLRSAARIPAAVVAEDSFKTAAARTRARFVVDRDKLWDVRSGSSTPLPSGGAPGERAAAIIELVAKAGGVALTAVARESIGKGLAKDPKALEAWAAARQAGRARSWPAQERAARDAIKRDGAFAAAHAELSLSLARQDRLDEALREADEAVRLDAASAAGLVARAVAFDFRNDVDEAEKAYRSVLAASPYESVALVNLGRILLDVRKDFPGAVEALEKARGVDATSLPATVNLGRAYLELGRTEEAIGLLKEAKAQQVGNAEVRMYLVTALLQAGRVGPAKTELADVAALQPGSPGVVKLQARVALADGDGARALTLLEGLLAANARDPEALDLSGQAREAKGDASGAQAAYRQALEIDPKGAGYARRDLALLLARQGDLDGAARILGEALQFNARDAEAHYNLGVAALARRELEAARKAFAAALQIAPHLGAAAYNLGLVEAERGDLVAAEKALRAAVARSADDGEAHLALGVVLRRKGDRDGALGELERALAAAAGRTRLEAERAVGLLLLERGEREKATPHLRAFVDGAKGPNDAAARLEIEKLLD